jgi:ribose-phosphate pyrophosphokinase
VLASQPFARYVTVDLHSAALETAFSSPLVHASGIPMLAKWLRTHAREDAVVVAPDLGAVKLARRYAHDLDLPLVVVHKSRTTGAAVSIRGIVGDVRGARPILVDDMISTGATIVAAATALLEAGCLPELTVVATHGVLVGDAIDRLRALPGCRVVVTDSLCLPGNLPIGGEIVSLAPLLAEIVQRLFRRGSLRALGIPV